jgi:hypothetical protein
MFGTLTALQWLRSYYRHDRMHMDQMAGREPEYKPSSQGAENRTSDAARASRFRTVMTPDETQPPADERAQRRARRKEAERRRMKKHGARLGETYRNAVLKRLRRKRGKR